MKKTTVQVTYAGNASCDPSASVKKTIRVTQLRGFKRLPH